MKLHLNVFKESFGPEFLAESVSQRTHGWPEPFLPLALTRFLLLYYSVKMYILIPLLCVVFSF